MADRTFVLVDAGMAAGFRLAKPSLGQLHQALVHLHRQHPDAAVAVLEIPRSSGTWRPPEAPMFEGDIIAGAIVCAPAGALDGTAGFLARAAAKAACAGVRGGGVHGPRHPGGVAGTAAQRRWPLAWDLDATRTLDADQIGPPLPAPAGAAAAVDRAARRRIGGGRGGRVLVALLAPAAAQEPATTTTVPVAEDPGGGIVPSPTPACRPGGGDRGGAPAARTARRSSSW